MSKEIIAKKAAIVEEVVEKFEKASSVVVVDYRGLTVEEVTNLRKELREAGVEMRVIKNTYLKRAADKAGYEGLDDTFSGPTAVAFADEDVTAPARILSKFAEDHEALEIKGGMIEGKVVSLEEIQRSCKITKPRRYAFYVAFCIASTSSQLRIRCQGSCRQQRRRCSLMRAS